jgi:hypothetical protein
VRPKIGDPSEKVTPEHINWVRDQFNRANLKTVWEGLAAESPRRGDLMKAVVRQAIRAGIYEVMSTGMKSMANIHADGTPLAFTEARGVRDDKDLDVELTEGSERDVAVWNASRGDAEVEAIRDVLAWARSIDPSTLSGKEKVVLQIVGNSGSCEACQKRLTAMADRIQSEWRLRAPNADLPRLDIWCYYSNDTDKRFKRGGYDTYNGWSDDVASPDLSLTGQGDRAWFVEVYEHQLLTYGPAPKRPEIADTSPESTITPVTIIPSTQTDSSKPSKEEDIS